MTKALDEPLGGAAATWLAVVEVLLLRAATLGAAAPPPQEAARRASRTTKVPSPPSVAPGRSLPARNTGKRCVRTLHYRGRAWLTAERAELMAQEVEPRLTDQAFTVGLVSALDLLLQASLQTILDGLSLDTESQEALLSHTGTPGGILADLLAWEVGGGDLKLRSTLSPADVEQCYLQALAWATEVCGVLDFTD